MGEPPLPEATARWAIFLDIDGTLLAIAPTPQTVRVSSGLTALLERLRRACDGAVALVSGRSLADIDSLFGRSIPAAGLHGLERRLADGTLDLATPSLAPLAPLRPVLSAYAAAHSGLLFEDKGQTLALHYRLAPEQGPGVRRLGLSLADAAGGALRLIDGDKVVELQPRGFDKGRAISRFLAEAPFLGRQPVFIGDDVTDEDGFAVVARRHGLAVRVTRGRPEPPQTAADYALPTVDAVSTWLDAVAARLARATDGRGDASSHPVYGPSD